MRLQVFVGSAEMSVTEEAMVGRQRRGMYRREYQMTVAVDESTFLLRVGAPEDEHQVFTLFGQGADGCIGKFFPALALVRTRLVGSHCQGGVQQQYSLFGPAGQVACGGDGQPQVALNLLEDVLQRRREGDAVVHREAEAMGLSRSMIGILSQDDHFHPVERTQVERVENKFAGGIDRCGLVFLPHKVGQADEVVLVEFRHQVLFPAVFYLYIHVMGIILSRVH